MADLQKRTLGRTNLSVTSLGFGAMELRGAPRGRDISDEEAGKLLNAVLDSGINFVDTSIDYGVSEERIGRHISHRRDEYFLASKCGCLVGWEPPPNQSRGGPHVYTKDNILAGVDQSLRRLNTDHLDLLQVHMTPSKQELEENGVVETLQSLQSSGKVRFIGMSGTLPNIREHISMGVFDVFQIPYSCLQREHEGIISEAAEAGAGIIIRGGAARGATSNSGRHSETYSTWTLAKIDEILDGMSAMEFVLRYTASHPDHHTNIVGTLNAEHLTENLEIVAKGPLPPEIYEEAKRRLSLAGAQPE